MRQVFLQNNLSDSDIWSGMAYAPKIRLDSWQIVIC